MNAASVSISICIPVFNQDVRKLMEQLMEQASRIALPIEIILAEDGSTGPEATYNRDFVQGTNIVYMHEETNIGRSAIRNLLAKHSKGTYLLYLDGDSSIENPHFLENYFRQIEAHPEAVLCGGTYFQKRMPALKYSLHYMYGTKVVEKLHSCRDSRNRFHFMSSNFVIPRKYCKDIHFDESLKQYGHEDTVFEYTLRQHEIEVIGIDNPILHDDLDENHTFLMKTTQAIENLKLLLNNPKYADALQHIGLVKAAMRMQRMRMAGFYRLLFSANESKIVRHLFGPSPSLHVLQAYKLYLMLKKEK